VQSGAPAALVEVVEHQLGQLAVGRTRPVLDMDSLLFVLGCMVGFFTGYFTAAVLVSEKASTMKDQKADEHEPFSMDQ
jgi:hypothetical protein